MWRYHAGWTRILLEFRVGVWTAKKLSRDHFRGLKGNGANCLHPCFPTLASGWGHVLALEGSRPAGLALEEFVGGGEPKAFL